MIKISRFPIDVGLFPYKIIIKLEVPIWNKNGALIIDEYDQAELLTQKRFFVKFSVFNPRL